MNNGRSSQPRSASLGLLQIARNKAFSSTQEAAQTLEATFGTSDYLDCIEDLNACGVDPQRYINGLDAITDTIFPTDPALGKRCVRALRKTCGLHGLLPTSHIISFGSSRPGPLPFASGSSSDTWRFVDNEDQDRVFAVKSFRVYTTDDIESVTREYYKGVITCKRVNHPNVLAIEGVVPEWFEFCIVSRWMDNGNMTMYMRTHPEADRLELLLGITRGLNYLHESEIVHGTLSSSQILVDGSGAPRISDFGLSSMTSDVNSVNASSVGGGGAIRWVAPEHLGWEPGSGTRMTKESDVYSLSMVMVELFTGRVPFSEFTEVQALILILRGERPPKPNPIEVAGLSLEVWKITEECWDKTPQNRPVVIQILECLEAIMGSGANPPTEATTSSGVNSPAEAITCSGGEPPTPFARPTSKHSAGCGSVGASLLRLLNTISRVTFRSKDQPDLASRPPLTPLLPIPSAHPQEREIKLKSQIDSMDKRLQQNPTSALLSELCETCSNQGLIPTSIRNLHPFEDNLPIVYGGGHSNVSKGKYEGREVAVKVMRTNATGDLGVIRSKFCREVVAWGHLDHRNILPLIGVILNEQTFAMVSDWMENGTINEFTGNHPRVNRTDLLAGVAEGLVYMHNRDVVHGDLKGANILVDGGWKALIADFGLLTITGPVGGAASPVSGSSFPPNKTFTPLTSIGTTRWMSPELLDPGSFGEHATGRPTKQSDCYALGMVIYEVLCGHKPYHDITWDGPVINAVMEGVQPTEPGGMLRLGFTRELWELLSKRCWQDHSTRPEVRVILSCLKDAVPFWDVGE